MNSLIAFSLTRSTELEISQAIQKALYLPDVKVLARQLFFSLLTVLNMTVYSTRHSQNNTL